MELNFRGLETRKGNIPRYKAKRVDEKTGSFDQSLLITPRVAVIKM